MQLKLNLSIAYVPDSYSMAADEAGKDTMATDEAYKAGKDTNSKHADAMEEDDVVSHSQHGTLMGQPRSYATILTTEIKTAQ
jgi:hypothetical protein